MDIRPVILSPSFNAFVFLDSLGRGLEGKLRCRRMSEGQQEHDGSANGPEIRKRAWHRPMTFPFLVT
jgi:hypothetical protein